jgi:DNA repair exonuclease SbcCD ATPase subunit
MTNKYEECKTAEGEFINKLERSNERYIELEDECSDRPQLIMKVEELKGMIEQLEEALKQSRDVLQQEKEKCETEIKDMLEKSTTTEKQLLEVESKYNDLSKRETENEKLIDELQRDRAGLELILKESDEKKAEKKIKEVKKEITKKAKKAIKCGPGSYYDKELKKCNKEFM